MSGSEGPFVNFWPWGAILLPLTTLTAIFGVLALAGVPPFERGSGLEQRIDLERSADAIAVGEGSVWVADAGGGIWRVDPESGELTELDLDLEFGVTDLTTGAGALWATNGVTGRVTRVSPQRLQQIGNRVRIGGDGSRPAAIAVEGRSAWIVDSTRDRLHELETVTATSRGPGIDVSDQPVDVAIGDGAVWVASPGDSSIDRVATTGGSSSRRPIELAGSPRYLAHGFGSLWVIDRELDRILRISANGGVVAEAEIHEDPVGISAGSQAVWIAHRDGTVTRVDPGEALDPSGSPEVAPDQVDPTGFVGDGREAELDLEEIDTGQFGVVGIAAGDEGVWIATESPGRRVVAEVQR